MRSLNEEKEEYDMFPFYKESITNFFEQLLSCFNSVSIALLRQNNQLLNWNMYLFIQESVFYIELWLSHFLGLWKSFIKQNLWPNLPFFTESDHTLPVTNNLRCTSIMSKFTFQLQNDIFYLRTSAFLQELNNSRYTVSSFYLFCWSSMTETDPSVLFIS